MGDRIKKMKTRCSVPFTAFGTGHLFLICFCRSISPSFVLVAVASGLITIRPKTASTIRQI